MLLEEHRRRLDQLVNEKPDITLTEMREALKLGCSLPAIHYVLVDMGLTYKKRLSMLASMARPDVAWARKKWIRRQVRPLIPPGSSSSTRPPRRRT